MELTLFAKGLILLAVPTAAQLAFLGLALRIQADHAAAQRWAGHTKEVIAQAYHVQARLADIQAGARGYAATRDPAFAVPFHAAARAIPDDLDRLERLVRDHPAQTARVAAVRAETTGFVGWQREVVAAVDAGDPDRAVARLRTGEGLAREAAVRRELAGFLAEEERLDAHRTRVLEESGGRIRGLLVGGCVASLLLAGGLAAVFRQGVSRRFATLVENTRRLAAGRDLTDPLTGGDEIARLDRAFRDMAADLGRAADRLRESARQTRDLYDHAPCGYHSAGPDGTVTAMNQTELRWLGLSAGQVVGRVRFADLVAPAGRGAYQAALDRVTEHGAAEVEVELVRADGTTFPVLLTSAAARDPDGRYAGSRSTVTDRTERKRAEDEVRRLNADLERRVRERTAELAEANRALAERNAENELFVYSVSHDLRAPLINLQGFGQELAVTCRDLRALLAADGVPAAVRSRAAELLDRDADEALHFIQAGVMRLSGIIDALLRLSRAGRVEYRPQWVDVAAVAGRVVESLHGTVVETGAAVEVRDLPPAWADPLALEQVFANLIGNALAYLAPDRPGRVEVGAVGPAPGADGGGRTFYVRDNGRGIPAAYQEKVFRAFQRVHPDAGPGEGMGLAIIRRVVERHRGRVWVESEPGVGSTFFVDLPGPAAGK